MTPFAKRLDTDWQNWPAEAQLELLESLRKLDQTRLTKSPLAKHLESQGWQVWLKTLFPRTFTKPFADFHVEFWEWYWPITLKRARGERLTLEELICLYILGRGSGKSSNVEAACIAEGALIGSGYVLYIAATEDQARDHLIAIKSLLESSEVAKYYPGLSNPELGKHGFRRGWSQEFLATQSGWGMIPAGLEEGIRGGRKDWMRFTMIACDDIDDFNDSPAASAKKLNQLSRSVVPAGTEDTVILFPQNIIHENSVMNQICTRRTDVFSTRKVIGPYPSFKTVELELTERDDGARVWDISSCDSNWDALDLLSARKFLSKSGRLAFMAEYQHDFEAAREGRVLRNYNDSLMVIDEDDFNRVFQGISIDSFNKYTGHDFARTKSQYHAPVSGTIAVSGQNTPLPGKLFLFNMLTFEGGTQADDMGKEMLKAICLGPNSKTTWDDLILSALSRAGLERHITDATRLLEARRDVIAGVIIPLVAPVLKAQNYARFAGSHDQNNDALELYRRVFGLPFQPVNPGESGGLEWADHYMQVDKTTKHPFFADELQADGKWKLGCPGFFVLVPRGKKRYPLTSSPETLEHSDFWRFCFNNWRMRPAKLTEGGVIEHGPMKMWDDPGQCLQMILFGNRISAVPLTKPEQIREVTPPQYRPETLQTQYSHQQEMAVAYQYELAKQKITKSNQGMQSFGEFGELIEEED